MRLAKRIKDLAPAFSTEIALNQDLQATALGISRRAIRTMRLYGVIDYPMTVAQYEVLAPLFRGIGTTELLRTILAGIDRPRREKLITTAHMGQMEAYSYSYLIRFRLEHLHTKRSRCTYGMWRAYMQSKFPKGVSKLLRDFYNKSRTQSKNAVCYALRTEKRLVALAAQYGLKKRDSDGAWYNYTAQRDKALKERKTSIVM